MPGDDHGPASYKAIATPIFRKSPEQERFMTAKLPDVHQSLIDCIRTQIEATNSTNWRIRPKNVETWLHKIMSNVVDDAGIIESCNAVRLRTNEYVEHIAELGISFNPKDSASVNAKNLALLALDDLQDRLHLAKLSPKAIALGH